MDERNCSRKEESIRQWRSIMSSIHAIVVEPNAAGRLVVREFAPPVPTPSEALVRVSAISLNLGEVRGAMNAESGRRPGWDLAGFVEQPAADGSGPQRGARVVGLAASKIGGGWAEQVAIPTRNLA